MPYNDVVPMERAAGRAVNGEQDVASPPNPVPALLPRKFKLKEHDRAKQPVILDFNGNAVVVKNSGCSREGFPSLVSTTSPAESLPSSFRACISGDRPEQTLEEGDCLPKTPPGRMFSYFCDLPPTPMAPKKSRLRLSAPLRKTQPRRLQFGAEVEGEDVPQVSFSTPMLASSQMLGVGSISPPFVGPSHEDDACRGFLPSDYGCGDSEMREGPSPRTPPDKLFKSFSPGDTPTATKCLRKGLGNSKFKRDWRELR